MGAGVVSITPRPIRLKRVGSGVTGGSGLDFVPIGPLNVCGRTVASILFCT